MAVGSEVGEVLGAKMLVVMIGERPGLSSPDTMGIYITPVLGSLTYEHAAYRLRYLMTEGRRRGVSGVQSQGRGRGPIQGRPCIDY